MGRNYSDRRFGQRSGQVVFVDVLIQFRVDDLVSKLIEKTPRPEVPHNKGNSLKTSDCIGGDACPATACP